MRAPLIVVTGTGTGIGKTHLACALLTAWGADARVCGLKPIETGVEVPPGPDTARLRAASTFHVKQPPPYALRRGVSPHLAAREQGCTIDPGVVYEATEAARRGAQGVVVELAGGLFTPLGPQQTNLELILLLAPTHVLLVAPDRLGVLHDVTAAVRASRAAGLALSRILLSAPAEPDASTGTNAREIELLLGLPADAVPRGPVEALSRHSIVRGTVPPRARPAPPGPARE